MKTTLTLLVCTWALAGCAAPGAQWQTEVMPSAGYSDAFQAARDVIAEHYVIATADPIAGVIETQPLTFQKTGGERMAGAYLSSGAAQNFRRKVTCRVERGQPGAVIEIRVDLQREGTDQAETLLLGTEGGGRREAGTVRQWEYVNPRTATYWADIGRDTAEESALLDAIRRKLETPAEKSAV